MKRFIKDMFIFAVLWICFGVCMVVSDEELNAQEDVQANFSEPAP